MFRMNLVPSKIPGSGSLQPLSRSIKMLDAAWGFVQHAKYDEVTDRMLFCFSKKTQQKHYKNKNFTRQYRSEEKINKH